MTATPSRSINPINSDRANARRDRIVAEAADGDRHIGGGEWVRDRLVALPGDTTWSTDPAGRELSSWLYSSLWHRVAALRGVRDWEDDIVQDALVHVLRSLHRSRQRLIDADNPAAVLERTMERAVACGRHRSRMAGLAGVPPNGRSWRARYPRRIGGLAAERLFEAMPAPEPETYSAVENLAARVTDWAARQLGVRLSTSAGHATAYVLDRLVDGVSRPALTRSGSSGLAVDPAMHHLGFDAATSRAFAVWLLGRHDTGHNAPSVLDAAVDDDVPAERIVRRWRRQALAAGFATDLLDTRDPRVA